jgi:hypothetical protein
LFFLNPHPIKFDFLNEDTTNAQRRRMRDKLDKLLRHFPANKSVVFAFDGSAPFAKLEVQRSRREVDITRAEISPGTSYSRKLQLCQLLMKLI